MKFSAIFAGIITIAINIYAFDVRGGPSSVPSLTITGTANPCIKAGSDGLTLNADCANARVGLGTTAPAAKLDVVGAANLASTASILLVSSNTVATNFLTVLNSGNVGLGTTAPTSILHVVGSAQVTSTLTVQGTGLRLGAATGGATLTLGSSAGGATSTNKIDMQADGYANPGNFNTNSIGDKIVLWNNGADSEARIGFAATGMTIKGMGTATSNILELWGAAANSGAPSQRAVFALGGNVGLNDGTPDAQLEVLSKSDTTGFIVAISSQNDTTGNILSVLGNGNVGVGTTAPGALLSVNGSADFGLGSNVAQTVLSRLANIANVYSTSTMTGATTGTGDTLRLIRGGTNAAKYNASVDFRVGTYAASINSQTQLDIKLGNGADHIPDTDVMSILGNGRVGIGTTAPLAPLDVTGRSFLGTRLVDVSITSMTVYNGASAEALFDVNGSYSSGAMRVRKASAADYASLQFFTGTGNKWTWQLRGTDLELVNGDYHVNNGAITPMTITDSTRRIGLGTQAPATKLHMSSGTLTIDGTAPNVLVGDSSDGGEVRAYPQAVQTIAATNTIAADACGTTKLINAGGNVTTSTTDTFTAPAASNAGCCMDVINIDTVDTITLDANANFNTALGADAVLTPCDTIRVCSDGTDWFQVTGVGVNTCN